MKKGMVRLFALGLTSVCMMGCGKAAPQEQPQSEPIEVGEDVSADIETSGAEDVIADSSVEEITAESAEEASTADSNVNESTTDNSALFTAFIRDEVPYEGKTYSSIYTELFDILEKEPVTYLYDMDNDGTDELLIDTIYYGWDIYDVKDGDIVKITGGEGTADICGIYTGNGRAYVGHSDFNHMGREYLYLAQYNADGEIIETEIFGADYDEESENYDENGSFYHNEKSITMQEYDALKDEYRYVEPSDMKTFKVDRSYSFEKGAVVNQDAVYAQYSKLVATLMPEDWDGFQLIDFDNDGIAELIATCTNEDRPDPGTQPYLIVGHNDEGLVKNTVMRDGVASAGGYRGTLYYLPKTGKILDSAYWAPNGTPSDTIYQMVEGEIVRIEGGYFEVDPDSYTSDDDWDPMEHGTWYWGDQEITEETYKEYFKVATENKKGSALCEIDYVDKEAILEMLK